MKELTLGKAKPKHTDNNNIFECDKCETHFKGSDIILEKEADNIHFLGIVQPIYIEYKTHRYIMLCPKCKWNHLFGFKRLMS